MSPDLLYYVPGRRWETIPATHSLWGVLTWDLAFGLLMWATWCWAAPSLWELVPQFVRARWRRPQVGLGAWKLVPIAILLGAFTHVGWDELTHAGRFGATHLTVLANVYPSPVGPLAGYRYLQYISGVGGLLALWWAWLRTPRIGDSCRTQRSARSAIWIVAGGGLLGSCMALLAGRPYSWRADGFSLLTSFISGSVLTTVALCAAHRARPAKD